MNTNALLEQLKEILKIRGITYKDIAAKLEMSESGVKKLFTNDDISMNKLFEILEKFDLSLADVLKLSKGHKKVTKLTNEQEKLFLKNSNYHNAIMQLGALNYNISEFFKLNHRVGKLRLQKILDELVKVGAILKTDDGYECGLGEAYTMSDKLNFRELQELGRNFDTVKLKSYSSQKTLKKEAAIFEGISFINLSQKSVLELKIALNEVFHDFLRRSTREKMLFSPNELVNLGVRLEALPMSLTEQSPIE
ncbi:MAG: helix-turn-helix domain-containing protein [Bdellovibrio sp.]